MADKEVYYGSYLQLEKVLTAQLPESAKAGNEAHDEMLFIIVHQAFELWFKQILHEASDVILTLGREYVPEAELLPEQFSILETMTPRGFMEFRDYLYPASGFQSWQFRLFEIYCGVSEVTRLHLDTKGYISRLHPEHQQEVLTALESPNLFSVVERWLEKMPFMESEGYTFWGEYRTAVHNIFSHDKIELDSATVKTNRIA